MAIPTYTLRRRRHNLQHLTMVFLCMCLVVFQSACSGEEQQGTEEGLIIKDDLGRELRLESQPKRVFAFAPSMTEMLFAVLDSSTIVARTPNDNFPAAALTKPVVSNYPIDLEEVLRLKSDLIFTIEGITPLDVAARLEELGVSVYYQKYESVEDIFTCLEDIGNIMGREEQAKHLADSLRNEVNLLRQRYKSVSQPQQVLAITWQDPIYVYGQNTLLTDKLHILGAENVVKEIFDQPYPALTREYVLKLNPDVLLGGTKEKLEQSFFSLYPELRRINAYKNNRIYEPNDDLMSRPGPRVVESLKELEGFLYK